MEQSVDGGRADLKTTLGIVNNKARPRAVSAVWFLVKKKRNWGMKCRSEHFYLQKEH